MSAVVVQDAQNNVKVLVSMIKNENEMSEKDLTESKQCINEFKRMMVSLNVYFQQNANNANSKYMNVSIPTNADCLAYMTRVTRSNVFNTLFEWLEYADKKEPNLEIKEIIQPNGKNLTNFIAVILKTPKSDVYSLYQGQTVYKEKFCSIDTAYGTGFEDNFYKYMINRFPSLQKLTLEDVTIKSVFVSHYYPITKTFNSPPEYSLYQYHFCNKTTYYLLLKNNEFQCEYILTPEIGRINFV
jgi:hypothetical protein